MHAIPRLRRRPLTVFVALALPAFLASAVAQAQTAKERTPTQAASDNGQPATLLDQVVVTGSRIPRATLEGPSPVTVITKQDIDAQGYRSAFDAISALTQNTGSVQGEDYGNTFTPAANTINLRGFGPNHTLVLVNGRRLADYPLAYEGSVNVVNLANIPSALIKRIEVLAGGASAVYGSDAVAGVVNIILQDKFDGTDINLRVGGTEAGGGQNQRLQVVSGYSNDRIDAVYGLELSHREAIWGDQRDFMDSLLDKPAGDPLPPTQVGFRRNARTNGYIDPGANCDNLGGLYHGSTFRANNPRQGWYCGSNEASPAFWTVQTQKKNADAYGSLTWHVSDRTDVFADLQLGISSIENNTRAPSWTSDNNYFLNQTTGLNEIWYRRIAPEEIGSAHANNNRFLERSWSFSAGVRGSFGESDWDYELAYNRGRYQNLTKRRQFLSGINEFYLGPRLGTTASGIGIYNPDPARLYTPLTPADYQRLTGFYESDNAAWIQNLSFTVNGELFDLPAGPVGFAGVIEAGNQGYRNLPDPRLGDGTFWNTTAGVSASGERDRYAIGAEISVPIFSTLTASAAARYDDFRFAGRKSGKATWNVGLEFRPIESLLLRATTATSFRAPDMNYIFAAQTRGYNPGMTDYWRCRTAGQDFDDCDYSGLSIDYTSAGNPNLKPENGKSYGFGIVWSPSDHFDVSVDYYSIRLDDQVTNLSSSRILREEADCRLGQTIGGEPRDINSPNCQDVLSRVIRNPSDAPVQPDQVRRVLINAINAASERTDGIDLKSNFRWSTGRFGDFNTRVGYTLVLKHDYQQFSDDPKIDVRNSLDYTDWRSKVNASLGWNIGRWNSNLTALRYGSLPNGDGSGRIAPYTRYNGSVSYRLSDQASVSLIVNNLRDSRPPADRSGGGWPFYPVGNYDPYGRQFWLEANYKFN
ncbi:TonB-dependent receptor plug domain-containing protein [Lysobacter capsici]|uniref:TonB-dependent receptor plug domain-containing protein n=1 Tax=Lysobacter capsici TaxID=435897 RepID=UPI000BBAC566|nr:TonB-dependent receptor [Lysobacter capsici]ATE72252.1 TonB-dependent receptor [Lysobacter capsici]